MKLYYQPTSHSRKPTAPKKIEPPFALLTRDRWDDQGHQITFDLFLYQKGGFPMGLKQTLLGTLSLVVEGFTTSADAIWNAGPPVEGDTRLFSIPHKFLSLGASLDFYSSLKENLSAGEYYSILADLHDVIFLEQKSPDVQDLQLREQPIFQKVLLRGGSALDVYGSARDILFADELPPDRFNFGISTILPRQLHPIEQRFRFDPEFGWPLSIYVLIGKNGLGKTQLLHGVLDAFLANIGTSTLQYRSATGQQAPPFRKIVALSFSPFETFSPKSLLGAGGVKYKYCGFKNQDGNFDILASRREIGPLLKSIIIQDLTATSIKKNGSRPKLQSLVRTISEGLDKEIRISVSSSDRIAHLVDVQNLAGQFPNLFTRDASAELTSEHIFLGSVNLSNLSAGQQLFISIAITIVETIEPGTLLLIDEPEQCLHPNLECAFIKMLRTILRLFEAHAIIATHSLFVARETPSRNISILRESDDETILTTSPKIETFGGDLSVIADYIFDNILQEKPFEIWLDGLVREFTSFEAAKAKLEPVLNLQSLIYLRQKFAETKSRHG